MKKLIKPFVLFFCLFLIAGNAYGIVEDDDFNLDLMAFYPFNGTAQDESGYTNHAEIHGAVLTTDRSGTSDSAYFLDGKDDFLSIHASSASDFAGLSQATFCAWIKTTDNQGPIIQQEDSKTLYKLALKDGKPYFLYKTLSDNWEGVYSSISVNDGKWHHITASMTGSYLKIFIDGDFHAQKPQKSIISGKGNITIGKMITGLFWFEGSVDDIRIYKRELSGKEIKKIFLGAYAVFPTENNGVLLENELMPLLWNDTSQSLKNQRYMVSVFDQKGIVFKELVVDDNILVLPPEVLSQGITQNETKTFDWKVELIADASQSVTQATAYTTLTSGSFVLNPPPNLTRAGPPGYAYGKFPYFHFEPKLNGGGFSDYRMRTYYGWFVLILKSNCDYTVSCKIRIKNEILKISATFRVNPFSFKRIHNFTNSKVNSFN
jgi:hypothetical protein